jgi:hypothetical protein
MILSNGPSLTNSIFVHLLQIGLEFSRHAPGRRTSLSRSALPDAGGRVAWLSLADIAPAALDLLRAYRWRRIVRE